MHRAVGGQLGGDRVADLALARGQLERQPGVEGREETVSTRHTGAGVQRLRGAAALAEDRLQDEGLVVAQAAHPRPDVVLQAGPVDELERVASGQQSAALPDRARERLADLLHTVQDQRGRLTQHERGDLAGRRIDGHLMGAQVVGAFGRHAFVEQLHLGMGELTAGSVTGHRASEDTPNARP